jgi:outer membrane protein OmpA-like peptidoglycan-associated protein
MRSPLFLAAASLAVAASLPWPAVAQVTLDQRALEKLGPGPTQPTPAPTSPVPTSPAPTSSTPTPRSHPPAPRVDAHAHPNGPHQKLPATPRDVATQAPMPTMPAAPPAAPVLPPPIIVPTRPQPPPAPPAVVAEAAGEAERHGADLRVTFAAGSADLNPLTEAAVRALAENPPTGSTFSVTAYAAGTPDDPSTARRLSLSRALAVRSVLILAGVASPRIYVKALGAAAPTIADGPPDRVDVERVAPAAGSSAPAPAPAQPQKAAP